MSFKEVILLAEEDEVDGDGGNRAVDRAARANAALTKNAQQKPTTCSSR